MLLEILHNRSQEEYDSYRTLLPIYYFKICNIIIFFFLLKNKAA